jgi:hypothetical protein
MNLNIITKSNLIKDMQILKKRISNLESLLQGQPMGTARIADAAITNAKIKDLSWSKGQGGSLILGGAANGNGIFSLKDASDVEIIGMDNTGLEVKGGKITVKDEDSAIIIDSKGIVSTANFTDYFTNASGTPYQAITSTGFTDITDASVSFSLDRAAIVLISAKFVATMIETGSYSSGYNFGIGQARLLVDSTNVDSADANTFQGAMIDSPYYIFQTYDYNFKNITWTLPKELSSGSHTIKLQAKMNNTNGGKMQMYVFYFSINYIILGR